MPSNKDRFKKEFQEITKPVVDDTKKRREFYSLVLILVPTVLIAITAQYVVNFFVKAIAMALILFFQAVIVRGMIENKN